jgi:DNA-directed RNA polymerase subunit L
MEIEVKKEDKKEIEFLLKGEGHSFSQMLVSQLLKNPDVESAQYKIDHPLLGNLTFYVRTKKSSPREALKKAAKEIHREIKSVS